MKFDWDVGKANRNLAKHQVAFDEAKTIFEDPLRIELYDPDHSEKEERYIIVGESAAGRLLIVSYTEREGSCRIISARPVTKSELKDYEEG